MNVFKWLWPSLMLTLLKMAMISPLILILFFVLWFMDLEAVLPYIVGICALALYVYHLHGFCTEKSIDNEDTES